MICRVGADAADLVARLEREAADHPWSAEAMASTLARPTARAWIARDGPDAVGHLVASVVADVGEVLTVGVIPAARRRGWGAALLAACLDHWREEGVAEGFLEVRAGNTAALALYAREGWRRVGWRRGYYADGEDAVLMRWEP